MNWDQAAGQWNELKAILKSSGENSLTTTSMSLPVNSTSSLGRFNGSMASPKKRLRSRSTDGCKFWIKEVDGQSP
jgi:hypothetical protein